jgi:hypothetical protein
MLLRLPDEVDDGTPLPGHLPGRHSSLLNLMIRFLRTRRAHTFVDSGDFPVSRAQTVRLSPIRSLGQLGLARWILYSGEVPSAPLPFSQTGARVGKGWGYMCDGVQEALPHGCHSQGLARE